jgi:5-formyltetrahydrofolate cyclo-ligase
MTMDEKIKRINELYHKSQKEGLSEEERREQAGLRRDFVETMKANVKSGLSQIDIVEKSGEIVNPVKQQQERQDKKSQIRKQILALRDAMPEAERARISLALADRIIGHQWFYKAKKILCFVSFGSEIDTTFIIEEAFRCGKEVYVPKVEPPQPLESIRGALESDLEIISFYQIQSFSDLKPGYRKIPEPSGSTQKYHFDPSEKDILLLMPGVAFDPIGRRLGYGKGFYDRFLYGKEELRLRSIAIGFACQMTEEIPASAKDIKPYQIITM